MSHQPSPAEIADAAFKPHVREAADKLHALINRHVAAQVAIASVKREPLADVPDAVLARALEQAAAETDDWAAAQFFEPSGEQQSVRCFRRMLELASAPPIKDSLTTDGREDVE